MSKNKQDDYTQILWSISRQFQGKQTAMDKEYNVSQAFKLLNNIISSGCTTQKLKEAAMILQDEIIVGKPRISNTKVHIQKVNV